MEFSFGQHQGVCVMCKEKQEVKECGWFRQVLPVGVRGWFGQVLPVGVLVTCTAKIVSTPVI